MPRWAEGVLRSVLGEPSSPPDTKGPLREPVDRFITEVGEIVSGLAHTVGRPPDGLDSDVAVEAFNIAAAIGDSDGRHSDDELWALIGAFGDRLPAMRFTGPEQLRQSGILDGKRTWVDSPSTLFEILVGHDTRDGTRTAWRYYELAMRIAHTTASIDAVPSPDELAGLDRLRQTLLDAMNLPSARGGAATPPTTSTPSDFAAPPVEELPPARPLEELLAELDGLIGLRDVKAEIHRVADLLQVMRLREERGLPVTEGSRHMVFTGNPGTGKTTVARLIAQIYRTLGVVKRGHLVETDRAGLVAGFVGQTALKTKAVVESALEGVLLIDEAYSLVRGAESDFGREAIDTIVKMIEDHRDDLVVIMAGYPTEMAELVEANPGMKSRFPRTIHFADYTTAELVAIFKSQCEKGGYIPSPAALDEVWNHIDALPRDKGFGNGRVARNLFEAAVARQASRIVAFTKEGRSPSDTELCALEPPDIEPASV